MNNCQNQNIINDRKCPIYTGSYPIIVGPTGPTGPSGGPTGPTGPTCRLYNSSK